MIKNIGRDCTERNAATCLRYYKPGYEKPGFFYAPKLKNKMKLIVIVLIIRSALVLIESKMNNRTKNF